MGNIRVSVHAITWGRDGLQQALQDLSDLGFRGIETFAYVADDYAGREDEFKEMLSKYGVQLVSLYGGGQMEDPTKRDEIIKQNLKYAQFLQKNGAKPLTLGPGRRFGNGPSDDDLREMAKTMNEIGKQTKEEYGVLACLHPHYGTTIQNRDEITRIMNMVNRDYVYLTADPAHMAKAGYDPTEVFFNYKDSIKYCHFKDYKEQDPNNPQKIEGEGGTAIIPDFVEFGQGTIDLLALIRILQEANYDGWMTIELDKSVRGARKSLEMNKEYTEKVLGLHVDRDNPF